MQPRSRDLIWDGCLNVRDLGGLPLAGGGETPYGAIVRSDSVSQLSEAGWRALVDYGIRTVLDLRGDHEREDDPPAELPVEVVHVPFLEASEAEWDEIAEELERANAATRDDAIATRDVYLIFLERFRDNVASSLQALADAPAGGVVVHCVGGKDRTGLLVAFLLHLAGVATRTSPRTTRSARSACARVTRSGSRPQAASGSSSSSAVSRNARRTRCAASSRNSGDATAAWRRTSAEQA